MRGPAQTSEPTIQFLYQVIESIQNAKILIPRFQRPLVWEWDRQSELLRSVKDGIPMGAIMIWRTSRDRIKWRSELAGHTLPTPPSGVPRDYLLDGLQRLSTLFAALRGFGAESDDDGADRSPLGYDLEEEAFVERFDPATRPHVVPLQFLPDSVTLLRFQRGLKGDRADLWIRRSDELAKAFREYKVPVIPIASDDFEVAARTFNLINSQGLRMDEADMIHALTWSPEFELRERCESLRSEVLQPVGWGQIGLDTILKVVKAESSLDLSTESVEAVSAVLRADHEAVDRAFEHLARAAELLRTRCGILSWDLVPYSVQAVFLADALRLAGPLDARSPLADWFWLTTYGEMFAGLSGHRLNVALRNLRQSVDDGQMRWSGASDFRMRPLPTSAGGWGARMKAVALMLARQIDIIESSSAPFRTLAEHGKDALFPLVPRRLVAKASYSSPGNRFLCAPRETEELKDRLLSGALHESDQIKHLISDAAVVAARAGNWDEFVQVRLKALSEQQHTFVSDLLSRHPISK
jgi:hypothetical protein